jgi:hypothetical protein
MIRLFASLLLLITISTPVFATQVFAAEAIKLKGRIVGEECANKGKIGECYLSLANPMVLWTEDAERFYKVRAAGGDLDQVALDKAFGLEVDVVGFVEGDHINIRKMVVLNPPGKKEFFKG